MRKLALEESCTSADLCASRSTGFEENEGTGRHEFPKESFIVPKRSMYAIYAYIGVVWGVNVGIYSIGWIESRWKNPQVRWFIWTPICLGHLGVCHLRHHHCNCPVDSEPHPVPCFGDLRSTFQSLFRPSCSEANAWRTWGSQDGRIGDETHLDHQSN